MLQIHPSTDHESHRGHLPQLPEEEEAVLYQEDLLPYLRTYRNMNLLFPLPFRFLRHNHVPWYPYFYSFWTYLRHWFGTNQLQWKMNSYNHWVLYIAVYHLAFQGMKLP